VFRADRQETVDELSRRGLPVWVADAAGEPLSRVDGAAPAALVLGSEAHGVSTGMRHAAVRTVSVPMRQDAESLNVAAAGAILLWELIGRGSG
jgi:TrmH family RNA methyltransferase